MELNKDNPRYLRPYVCVDCHKSFKRPVKDGVTVRPCPDCGKPAHRVNHKFRAPRKDDIEQWKKVRFLFNHGFWFDTIRDINGNPIPYPNTLADAREWVVNIREKQHSKP